MVSAFFAPIREPIPAQDPPTLPQFQAVSHSDATGMFINETHTSAAIWQYRVEKMILEGKTLVVTGVGPGLGREVARIALRDGANVVLAARRREKLEATARELDPSGKRVALAPTDITDAAQCQKLVATAEDRVEGVDPAGEAGRRPDRSRTPCATGSTRGFSRTRSTFRPARAPSASRPFRWRAR